MKGKKPCGNFCGSEKEMEELGEARGMPVVGFKEEMNERLARGVAVPKQVSSKMPIVKIECECGTCTVNDFARYKKRNNKISQMAEEAGKLKPYKSVEKVFYDENIAGRGFENVCHYAKRLDSLIEFLCDYLSGSRSNLRELGELWDVENEKLTDLQLLIKINNSAMNKFTVEQSEIADVKKLADEQKSVFDALVLDSKTKPGKAFVKDAAKNVKRYMKTLSKDDSVIFARCLYPKKKLTKMYRTNAIKGKKK